MSSTWDAGNNRYVIDLDQSYFFSSFATTVTTICDDYSVRTSSVSGNLLVLVSDGANNPAQCGFGFISFEN